MNLVNLVRILSEDIERKKWKVSRISFKILLDEGGWREKNSKWGQAQPQAASHYGKEILKNPIEEFFVIVKINILK
ncbi:unnamed protein product [Blepharisma stoltei]|uniref:Uncharacterized protein n=1 Tax=Blepharisma stoltei TaxID=1481888 RepID=A0AAU9IZZ4_9CILI|nr:unnamed protein product [Blepharisma stoltei]